MLSDQGSLNRYGSNSVPSTCPSSVLKSPAKDMSDPGIVFDPEDLKCGIATGSSCQHRHIVSLAITGSSQPFTQLLCAGSELTN